MGGAHLEDFTMPQNGHLVELLCQRQSKLGCQRSGYVTCHFTMIKHRLSHESSYMVCDCLGGKHCHPLPISDDPWVAGAC